MESNYTQFTLSELLVSLEETIENLKKAEEQLSSKDNQKKESMIDRLLNKRDDKKRSIKISELTRIYDLLFELHHNERQNVSLSPEIQASLESVGGYLSSEENKQLSLMVNKLMSNNNKDAKQKTNELINQISKLLDDLNLTQKSLIVKKAIGNKSEILSYSTVLDRVSKLTLEQVQTNYVTLNPSEMKDSFDPELTAINHIADLAQDSSVVLNKNDQNVLKNLNDIKTAHKEKKKLEDANLTLTNLIQKLQLNNELDFTEVINFLNKIVNKNQKDIEVKNAFLAKFDLEHLLSLVEQNTQTQNQEQGHQDALKNYENLCVELERLNAEEPHNTEKKQQILAEMANLNHQYGLSDSEVRMANINAQEKYQKEKYDKRLTEKARSEEVEENRQARDEAYQGLRNLAIKELESSGLFNQFEVINDDVKDSIPLDQKEKLIQEKISELIKRSNMSPEERGIEEEIKSGYLKEGTTVNDLSVTMLNDFRLAYGDGTKGYEHAQEVKNYQNQITPFEDQKVKTIHQEYIKYLAAMEDKTKALKFSDFVAQIYGVDKLAENFIEPEEGIKR